MFTNWFRPVKTTDERQEERKLMHSPMVHHSYFMKQKPFSGYFRWLKTNYSITFLCRSYSKVSWTNSHWWKSIHKSTINQIHFLPTRHSSNFVRWLLIVSHYACLHNQQMTTNPVSLKMFTFCILLWKRREQSPNFITKTKRFRSKKW